MFGKTNYAICGLAPEGEANFTLFTESYDETMSPKGLMAKLKEEGGEGIAVSPFNRPLGEDGGDLTQCEISEQVYAIWLTQMSETTLQDPRVLQEHLSFESYGTPFKFLPKEQKQDITDQMSSEERMVEQTHVPMILDFKQGRLWVANTNKNVLAAVREFLANNGMETSSLTYDFGTNDWPSQVLSKIVEGDIYLDAFLARAADVKKEGDPKLVEANENPVMEKILKKYFRCMEHDGYSIFLGSPSKLHLGSEVTTVSVNTPFDGTEVLNNDSFGVASARITVSEGDTNRMDDLFSVEISDSTHVDPGFIVVKGLEAHDLSRSIKETGTAAGRLTLKDYWACDYERNQVALARVVILVMGLLGIQGDYGIKPGATKETQAEV